MFTLNSVQKQYLRQKHFTFKILLLMIVIKPFINTFHDTNIFAGITFVTDF